MTRYYLDHAATSPLRPEVREAMLPWLDAGNASSLYLEGRRAKDAVDEARERVSGALGCGFGEVIFTSGGTEAANLAMIGTALGHRGSRRRILIAAAEHHCVLHTRETLERIGFQVELLRVDRYGRLMPETLAARLDHDVLLLAVMHANNELGTLNEVAPLASLAHQHGVLVFVDAVQTFRRATVNPADLGADLLAVSGHKIGGPKGAGALFVRGGVKPKPLLVGGGQERELRAGTENVSAIVGFGLASVLPVESSAPARDAFERALAAAFVPTVSLDVPRLPGHAHYRLPGVRAESLLILLDRMGVSASAGAACSSGAVEASHVLLACGFTDEEAKEGVRFTFGPGMSVSEAESAAKVVSEAASRLVAGKA